MRAVADRHGQARGLAEVELEALDLGDEAAQGHDARRSRAPRAQPERVRHHRALREAAEHGPLGRDAVLGEQAVEPAGQLADRWRGTSRDRGSPRAARRTSGRRPAAATAARARWRRAGAARDRGCRAAGTGRARRPRARGRGRVRPRASPAAGLVMCWMLMRALILLYGQLLYSSAPRRGGAGGLARDAARARRADEGARRRARARAQPPAVVVRGAALPGRRPGRAHAHGGAGRLGAPQPQRPDAAGGPPRARGPPEARALRERRARLLRRDHAQGPPTLRRGPRARTSTACAPSS